jgi:hypothetical protein
MFIKKAACDTYHGKGDGNGIWEHMVNCFYFYLLFRGFSDVL